ncbi:MAG: VWA domain-containing protein [Tannerella sp.]|jgi:Ca-activated chloride channel family protein|nr:VWA domain-containing protein [Tannerella sp.]
MKKRVLISGILIILFCVLHISFKLRAANAINGNAITENTVNKNTLIENNDTDQSTESILANIKHLDYKRITFYVVCSFLILLIIFYISLLISATKKDTHDLQTKKGFSIGLHFLFIAGIFILALCAILSSPLIEMILQKTYKTVDVTDIEKQPNTDLIYLLDVSSSMLAEDFSPNRLEATKNILAEPGNYEQYYQTGLIVFGKDVMILSSLTDNSVAFRNAIENINRVDINKEGTAISSGLITSIDELIHNENTKKYIILFTDGANNRGEISLKTAAEIAYLYNIELYVVGVCDTSPTPYPVESPFGIQYRQIPSEIDEEALKEIAYSTGGEYFRTTNNNDLKKALEKIHQSISASRKKDIHNIETSDLSKEKAQTIIRAIAENKVYKLNKEK